MTRERKRRQYGSGSIHQRKDGRWAGTVEAGYTANGTRRRITVTARTEAEAKAKLKERQRQISDQGAPLEGVDKRVTVKAWSEDWLERTKLTLRPKPWATDRSALTNWIIPTIGHIRLEALTPTAVRAVADAQRMAGRSSSTALRTHSTLTGMLRAAILEGHQIPRRVLDTPPPRKAVSDAKSMSTPEAIAVLHAASFLPHGSRWAVAILGGIRQGECLGLTWDRVDLDAGMIFVQWELQQVPYVDRKSKGLGFRLPEGLDHRHLIDSFHLLPPKTKAGARVVPLVPALVEALREWREVAPENPWNLVWPRLDGYPSNEKVDREEWHGLQGAACVGHPDGRYYRPHEARHTTATALLESGTDPKVVTEILGHSSILTSHGYMHTSKAHALDAMKAVAGRLQPIQLEG